MSDNEDIYAALAKVPSMDHDDLAPIIADATMAIRDAYDAGIRAVDDGRAVSEAYDRGRAESTAQVERMRSEIERLREEVGRLEVAAENGVRSIELLTKGRDSAMAQVQRLTRMVQENNEQLDLANSQHLRDLERLTVERDEARAQARSDWERLTAERVQLQAEAERLERERDEARAALDMDTEDAWMYLDEVLDDRRAARARDHRRALRVWEWGWRNGRRFEAERAAAALKDVESQRDEARADLDATRFDLGQTQARFHYRNHVRAVRIWNAAIESMCEFLDPELDADLLKLFRAKKR